MAPALGAGHTVVLKLPKTRCISVLEFIKEIAQVLPPGVVNDVLSWPYIEPRSKSLNHLDRVSIRLQEIAATDDLSAFIHDTEFARVLLEAPTIIMVLPLVCAHWPLLKGGPNRITFNLSDWCRLGQ
jgi:hypothetical protein